MLTGELAIPIGFHINWNLAQCVVFGLPVSGMKLGGGMFALQASGPSSLDTRYVVMIIRILSIFVHVVAHALLIAAIFGWRSSPVSTANEK